VLVLDTHTAVWWAVVHADELTMQADTADRFIAATALHHAAPLVSKDRLMRSLRFLETIW
jgi:PIN domain nuclease of toxin-antitoxin system